MAGKSDPWKTLLKNLFLLAKESEKWSVALTVRIVLLLYPRANIHRIVRKFKCWLESCVYEITKLPIHVELRMVVFTRKGGMLIYFQGIFILNFRSAVKRIYGRVN